LLLPAHLSWIVPIMDASIPQSGEQLQRSSHLPSIRCHLWSQGRRLEDLQHCSLTALMFLSSVVSASLLRIVVQAHLDTALVFWDQQTHSPGGSDPRS